MRDGEQSPGASMSIEDKLQIAEQLQEMAVDIVEAGFPNASEGDFEAVSLIAKQIREVRVCGLARANEGDIARAGEALRKAAQPRIHTFLATSDLHMRYKLKMTPEEVLARIEKSVFQARNLCDDVQWSPEDATRSDHDFLCRAVETAIRAGASTINIPDTVGYTVPMENAALIRMLLDRVPDMDRVVISTHCHNDLGLAVANALAAVAAGARQVECTINGLGERAGNAALEEIVMALQVRGDVMPYHTGIKTRKIMGLSGLISSVTGFPVQYNKAVVGKNAFSHEAGIHQDGMLKHAGTYEIMRPEDVGLSESRLAFGKHSGRGALAAKLAEFGYKPGDNVLQDIFIRFKHLADRKREIYDEDILALIEDANFLSSRDTLKMKSLHVVCGTVEPKVARMELLIDGETQETEASGNGPVDAAFHAIRALYPHDAQLADYHLSAVTEGTDAQAKVSVQLQSGPLLTTGYSAGTDIVVASAQAYINALNRLLQRQSLLGEKTASNSKTGTDG